MYIAMFFTDITLFYLIPLVLSVVLYTLIAVMLLFTAPRTFNDGTSRNQARLQVRAHTTLYLKINSQFQYRKSNFAQCPEYPINLARFKGLVDPFVSVMETILKLRTPSHCS